MQNEVGSNPERARVSIQSKMFFSVRTLQESLESVTEQRRRDVAVYEEKLSQIQKQSQDTIQHLTRKCDCLTKLYVFFNVISINVFIN